MKNLSYIALFVVWITSVNASDTLIYSYDQFLYQLREHHPVMERVSLLNGQIDAKKMEARGQFDPKLGFHNQRKSFDNKNYYNEIRSELKAPMLFGANAAVDYENNEGQFLDNSAILPSGGLMSLGIEMPLSRGLIFDQRRKVLQEAELFERSTENKQRLMINKLFFSASKSYFEWQANYNLLLIIEEAKDLAFLRYQDVKSGFNTGDMPAIDTLESYVNYQARLQLYNEIQQDYTLAFLELQNFLWEEGQRPLVLNNNVIPQEMNNSILNSLSDSISIEFQNTVLQHPELIAAQIDQEQLELDLRMAKEMLKPLLNVKYNPLIVVSNDNPINRSMIDNYKLGIEFSYPLFTRKERAKVQMSKLYLQDNDLIQSNLTLQLTNLLNQILENDRLLDTQIDLGEEMISRYQGLLDAENEKFSIGESSVFLVNSREIKLLEVQQKQIKILKNLFTNRLSLLYQLAFIERIE